MEKTNDKPSAPSGMVEPVVLNKVRSHIKDQIEHCKTKRESDIRGQDWWQSRVCAYTELLEEIDKIQNAEADRT